MYIETAEVFDFSTRRSFIHAYFYYKTRLKCVQVRYKNKPRENRRIDFFVCLLS